MDNQEMLEKIRLDRPNQVINEVISFKKNKYGFYDVIVDMELVLMGTKILHTKQKLPYPFSEYDKLSEDEQFYWRLDGLLG